MKIGVLTNTLRDYPFDEALEYLASLGYQTITVGGGGLENLEGDHCTPKELLESPEKLQEFKDTIARHGLELSTIACPANTLHPQKAMAEQQDRDLRNCILLAEKLGIDNVSTFSGCPGSGPDCQYPNWVTYDWPYDFGRILKWQWEEVAIPYWRDLVAFAREHGVTKIGMEFHPNQLVYNPETLLRLRDAVGPEIGVCLDVSHLFWMGMDPAVVIEALAGCIWQFHAKDSVVWDHRVKLNGVLDTKPNRAPGRVFNFCVPGCGHDLQQWKRIVRALRAAGYDRDLCFEHEDLSMGQKEGLAAAAVALKSIVQETPMENCGMYWKLAVGDKMKELFFGEVKE